MTRGDRTMKRILALLLAAAMVMSCATALAAWTCTCGAANEGGFCTECGTAKPSAGGTWKCACGRENDSKFCPSCGRSKEAANSCAACGRQFGEGESYRFCPSCGAATDGAAAPASRTFRVTEAHATGDGGTSITWEDSAGGGPYTVYCCFGAGNKPTLAATDVYGTSCVTYAIEPGMTYRVWVTDGQATTEEFRYYVPNIADSYHDQVIARTRMKKLTNGAYERVSAFSADELNAFKAYGADGGQYPYVVDLELDYDIDSDRYVRVQVFILGDSLNNYFVGYEESMLLPAGDGCMLSDVIDLSEFIASEDIAPGLCSISVYFDGLSACMGLLKIE